MRNEIHAVLVAPAWPPEAVANGVLSYVSRLLTPLREAGADVRVLARSLPEPLRAQADADGVPCSDAMRARLRDKVRSRVLRAARQDYVAEVLVHASRVGVALRQMHRERPVDLYEIEEAFGSPALTPGVGVQVVRLHGPWFLVAPALGMELDTPDVAARVRLEGKAIAGAGGLTSPSQHALDAVRAHYGLPCAHARVIPNATPLAPQEQRWSRARAKPRSLLFVGRFDRLKGADTVLEAFARIHANHPDASLTFAGPDRGMPDGAGGTRMFEEYVAHTLPAPARAAVTYLGAQTPAQVAALRPCAEITLVASRFETFGMTVIEALAAGSPVLSADGGALPEVLSWAQEELCFRAGDAQELAARIEARFAQPDRTDLLASEGLRVCAERFSPESVARQTLAYYRECLAARR